MKFKQAKTQVPRSAFRLLGATKRQWRRDGTKLTAPLIASLGNEVYRIREVVKGAKTKADIIERLSGLYGCPVENTEAA